MSEQEAQPQVEAQEQAPNEVATETTEGNSEEQLLEAVADAKAEGATKKEIQNLMKEFDIKVNGKSTKRKIDLSNHEEVRKELQMAAAGREAMETKAEYEKALKTLIDKLQNDPLALAEELGMNADELAAIRLQKRIEQAKKSPEQVEKEKLEREISEYRRKEEEQTKKLQEAEQNRVLKEANEQIDTEIEKALEGYKSLPANSPMVYDMIAKNMVWVMDNFEQFGYANAEDVRVEDVLPTVEKELKQKINALLDNVPDEFLDAWVGQKVTDRQRKKRLANAKNVSNINNIKKTVAPKEEVKKELPPIRISDWMREGF